MGAGLSRLIVPVFRSRKDYIKKSSPAAIIQMPVFFRTSTEAPQWTRRREMLHSKYGNFD